MSAAQVSGINKRKISPQSQNKNDFISLIMIDREREALKTTKIHYKLPWDMLINSSAQIYNMICFSR